MADLFKLQDQVVARLANTLDYELIKAEAAKGARSTNPDANDLVMRGLALTNEPNLQPSKDKSDAARTLFEQALAIDPNNAAAIAGVAKHISPSFSLDGENPRPITTPKSWSGRPGDRPRSRLRPTVRV